MHNFLFETVLRAVISLIIGGIIGSERARHGRAAGMRTHILVALGSCLTSMTSVFIADTFSSGGDISRIPAQVISGIGFLGAGVIILRSNNMITGLTTAAGVWATATIGIAVGYGYYAGAVIVTLLFLATTVLFSKFEKVRKSAEIIYIEIDDAYAVNSLISQLEKAIGETFTYQIFAPKSGIQGNVGIDITVDKVNSVDINKILQLENVVFSVEE